MKLSQKSASATTRVCVIGLSGTGKSTLVAKLAEAGFKLYWITVDNDTDILFKISPEFRDNVELYDIPDTASSPRAADTLLKLFREKKGEICNTHGLWKCAVCKKESAAFSSIDLTTLDPEKDIVVIDTGTTLGHSIMAHATKNNPVDYKPERDDWGALRKWTEFFYSEFQGARFNLVVIFHAVEATMEDDKVKLVPAFGSKDMSSKIAGAFSHVVYCDIKNKKHVAYSGSTAANNVLTKSRSDFLIESLPEPSLAPIFLNKAKETTSQLTPQETKLINTPATNALSALEKLRLKNGTTT
jgi:hypothetical protein